MRASLPAAGISLLFALGCADLLGPKPSATLTLAQIDACGNLKVEVDATANGLPLRVEVNDALLGGQLVNGQVVYRGEKLVEPHGIYSVSVYLDDKLTELRILDAPDLQWRARLASGEAWHTDTRGNAELRLDVSCPLPKTAQVRWEWFGTGSEESPWVPLDERRSVRVSPPPVVTGAATLRVELGWTGPKATDRQTVRVSVVDGCVDLDGDGKNPCNGDCDERYAEVHRGAKEIPGNGLDDDCDGVNGTDADRDGFESAVAGGDDCDDSDPARNPMALEVIDADGDGFYAPNGRDDDCDGAVDEGPYLVAGKSVSADDCDDALASVNPGATEHSLPNQRDDDCDGMVDEGTIAYDDDGDGFSENQGDCDDAQKVVYPGAPELPDCLDQDCDRQVDEGVTRAQTDDGFEPNDSKTQVRDLGTNGRKSFAQELTLVTRDAKDEEWFSFYSQDGDWDSWGIFANVTQRGVGVMYSLEVYDSSGSLRASGTNDVHVTGRWLRDDTGMYTLRVRPTATPLDWCPAVVKLSSR